MNLTTQKRMIYAATAGFAAVAMGGMAWSLGSIEPTAASANSNRGGTASIKSASNGASTNDAPEGPKVDFAAPMQQSLFDRPKPPSKPPPRKVVPPPPRKVVPPPAPRKPKLDWTLVGTIIDGDNSLAILADASGKTDIRRAGETVELEPGGVSVQKIDAEAVTLDISGRESTLKLKQNFNSNGGGPPGRANRRRTK